MSKKKDTKARDKKNTLKAYPATPPSKQNIESIMRLEQEAIHRRSNAERLADKIPKLAGSTPSIVIHTLWFAAWVIVNTGMTSSIRPFDPFPFSFLTLVVSLEAIFLSLLVLMSQNRMIRESDKRAHLDLQVNLLAEQEATMVLRTIQRVAKHLGLKEEIKEEEIQHLEKKTDVHRLAKDLVENLPEG